MLGLPKILFRTFILSVIIGIAATCIWYAISHKQDSDYSHVLPLIVVGALFLNGVLVLMSVPVLFLANPAIRKNKAVAMMLYFAGPVLLLVTVLIMKDNGDKAVYMLMTFIYLIVHTFFYFRTARKLE